MTLQIWRMETDTVRVDLPGIKAMIELPARYGTCIGVLTREDKIVICRVPLSHGAAGGEDGKERKT